ncbi:hypothetical protein [Ideonella sp. YS5]|uniref:hypothetical protein n=1 Tax=Ideonella sp. YS5 TaxID=3453714 RepID=UPI003EF05822
MTTTPTTARTIAGLLGATLLAAATFGLAGCNKRDNTTATVTTTPSTTMPAASDSMPASPSASAASQ